MLILVLTDHGMAYEQSARKSSLLFIFRTLGSCYQLTIHDTQFPEELEVISA